MNKLHVTLWSIACATIATPAHADSLRDRLAAPPDNVVSGTAPLPAIEHCIGIAVSEWFVPATLRGIDRVEIYGANNTLLTSINILFSIIDEGPTRRVEIRAGKAWNDRSASIANRCANGAAP